MIKKIIIDPGHGGTDSGAVSKTGIREDILALNTAFYLTAFLREIWKDVYILRANNEDTYLVNDRMAFIKKNKSDLVISIHYNAAANEFGNGTEVFYQFENTPFGETSKKLAKEVCSSLVDEIGFADRGAKIKLNSTKDANFLGILRSAAEVKTPAILIEAGFVTNAGDVMKSNTMEKQKKIARAIFKGITKYLLEDE